MKVATDKVELLRRVALFAKCTDRELARIAALADVTTVPPGHPLTTEGRPGREAFVITRGEADATVRGRHLARLGPGVMVGEMALLDNGPRSATVTARTELEVLVLDPRSFRTLLLDVPSIADSIMRVMATRLRQTDALLS